MSKFLYPIYKLNIESYKKWWLYHKKAGGSGILSEILQGFSFNLENTLNRKFKLFDVEGNSVQDGSPSPDNEVLIESAGDNGTINEKIQNKNLIANLNKVGNNVYINTTSGLAPYMFEAGTYTLSYSSSKTINSYMKTETGQQQSLGTGKSITVTANEKFNIWLWASGLELTDIIDVQLEIGSTATPYVPHEEQDYSIFVQQPMRSIGDVRDGFAKIDGVWNEVHPVGNKILNGTEGWSKQNTSSTSNSLFICWGYVSNPGKATACPNSYGVLSNYFKKVTENIWTGAYKGIDVYGNQAFICVSNEIASTVADFKTWLSTHNVEVNYVLKNPTYLPCTQSQIEVLENMPSTYKEMTIINSEYETPAHLKIQYWKEVQS